MNKQAYSLVEVLVAGAILAIVIFAATLLATSILTNQENNSRAFRALNVQEQAGKLFYLGLHPTTITNILPEVISTSAAPGTNGLSFSNNGPTNVSISGAGNLTVMTNRAVFHSGTDADGTISYSSNTVILIRPLVR